MEFNILDKKGIALMNEYLSRTDYNGCDYSYAYQCAWMSREPECLRYAVDDGIFYVVFSCIHLPLSKGELVFLPPLTVKENLIRGYEKIFAYAESIGKSVNVIQAPREHISLLDPDIYAFEEYADYAEYLYSTSDLTELKGKKYHAKRNHIAKFKKLYPNYVFRDYEASDYDAVMNLFDIWRENKEDKGDSRELYAIKTCINNIEKFGLKACVLYVGGELAAFTVGELTANNVGIVHFEKANIEFEGAYSVINNLFAVKYLSDARIINRQEDMGIEGLRKAKMSYYPIAFQEKWAVKKINCNI